MATNFNASGVPLDDRYVTWEEIGVVFQSLWSAGDNQYGQLGDGTIVTKSSHVQTTFGGTDWKTIGCGYFHTHAIKLDGTLWAWGRNDGGQLGLGDVGAGTDRTSPVQVGSDTNWKSVHSLFDSVIALKTDNTLWCWGKSSGGTLGTGDSLPQSSPVQTIVGGVDWKEISSGFYYSAAIKTDGTLWLWGTNNYGQLGTNDITNRLSPTQISVDTTWEYIDLGRTHTSAIKTDGTLWTWGSNSLGQLGLGDTTSRSSPTQVGVDSTWKYVSSTQYSTSAIKTDGTLWSWGQNSSGQLGINNTLNQSSPVQIISGGNNWLNVSAGGGNTVVAVKTDGTLWGWGTGANGQLGVDSVTNRSSPVQIGTLTTWTEVSAGASHTAALRAI